MRNIIIVESNYRNDPKIAEINQKPTFFFITIIRFYDNSILRQICTGNFFFIMPQNLEKAGASREKGTFEQNRIKHEK